MQQLPSDKADQGTGIATPKVRGERVRFTSAEDLLVVISKLEKEKHPDLRGMRTDYKTSSVRKGKFFKKRQVQSPFSKQGFRLGAVLKGGSENGK